jgi:hypothetical protein
MKIYYVERDPASFREAGMLDFFKKKQTPQESSQQKEEREVDTLVEQAVPEMINVFEHNIDPKNQSRYVRTERDGRKSSIFDPHSWPFLRNLFELTPIDQLDASQTIDTQKYTERIQKIVNKLKESGYAAAIEVDKHRPGSPSIRIYSKPQA